ncbi:hypothetical protein ACFQ10_09010 [Streptomyces indonesiensis]
MLDGLAARGAEVVAVEVAETSREALGDQVKSADGCAGVVSLLSWDDRADTEYGTVSVGTAATLAATQALRDHGVTAPLWCVTSGGVAVAGEAADPVQSAVWGFGAVLGLDHPDTFGGLIDLPAQGDDEELPDGLFAALCSPEGRINSRCAPTGSSRAGCCGTGTARAAPGSHAAPYWSRAAPVGSVHTWRAGSPRTGRTMWCCSAGRAVTRRVRPNWWRT